MSPRYAYLPGIIPVMIGEWVITVLLFRYYKLFCCKEEKASTSNNEGGGRYQRNELLAFSQTFTSHGDSKWGRTILLVKRLFCLGYMFGNCVINGYLHSLPRGWFYFTVWNTQLMSVYFSLSVACSLISIFASQELLLSKSMYRFGLFVQVVFEVTGGTAFFVTIISFVLLNPVFTFWNGSLHFATSMFMLSELLMSDIPVRFDHYPINLSWALLYLVFIWPLTVMKTSPSPKWL